MHSWRHAFLAFSDPTIRQYFIDWSRVGKLVEKLSYHGGGGDVDAGDRAWADVIG